MAEEFDLAMVVHLSPINLSVSFCSQYFFERKIFENETVSLKAATPCRQARQTHHQRHHNQLSLVTLC